jgi:hypothetical protein
MQNPEKISNPNQKWFMVEIIEKLEPAARNESKDLRRVTTYGNFHLIKASSADEAYEKGVKLGQESSMVFTNSDKVEMEWSFLGIGELLPIYEDIQDGAELMYTDYGNISYRRAINMAREKSVLLKAILKTEK